MKHPTLDASRVGSRALMRPRWKGADSIQLAHQLNERCIDRDGKLLTDRYLVNKPSEQYDWVTRVYERTSGYVHLSSTHVMSVTTDVSEAKGGSILSFHVGVEDKPLPDWIYIEMCDGFRACAEILLRYINGWGFTKANFHLVQT